MATDRTVRSLTGLSGASSSRVLNLVAINLAQKDNPEHGGNPFFVAPTLNNSIIIKHRLRSDEVDSFVSRRTTATKVIVPFETWDLRSGGRSVFVDQRGFEATLRAVGNYADEGRFQRDLQILKLIDSLPSLDPFLLREQLRRNGLEPGPSYFAISEADQKRMYDYTAVEMRRLTSIATGGQPGAFTSESRMVSALLSNEVNEKLEPLRATLNLNPEDFGDGVFCWRGFIYYKWNLLELWPRLIKALRDLKTIIPLGKPDHEQACYMASAKQSIIAAVRDSSNEVRRALATYDEAFANLTERRDPKTFREFLLSAPEMFLDIGERMGIMAHISSFWDYRFPAGAPRVADSDELSCIFQDFAASLGLQTKQTP